MTVLIYRDLKKYIKTSSCYPDRCRKSDYENIMQDFKTSEKVKIVLMVISFLKKLNKHLFFQIHFLLLVSEAKLQSSLLYAMRAVSEHFS